MRERKDGDPIGIGPIHNSERKILEKNSPSILCRGRTSTWKCQGAGRSVLDGRSETRAKPGLFLVIVDDFDQKFAPRCRDESGTLHRVSRRASAKTSSAA